ncbi:MAG TPA: hypothetical protein VMH38_01840 [Thermoplasmata archaeon]|nr:hypothetical protein [Thermoplasmata archaeon]
MDDACYFCRRTQVDLDRMNEEIRTRVYLSYFSNLRAQIDDQHRRITFLQRLKDEESSDPHFRINAKQVFGDPKAYEKLMPWIDSLVEISRATGRSVDEKRTMGELVEEYLAEERRLAAELERGLERLRGGFTVGDKQPLRLESVTYSFPVEWSLEGFPARWKASQPGDREPLRHPPGQSRPTVDLPVHVCSVCRKILEST